MAQRSTTSPQPPGPEREDRDSNKQQSIAQQAEHIPVSEWIVAVCGLVLVLGSIGFMLYQAVAGDASPPMISVRTEAILATPHGYVIQIRAVNHGGATAAQVKVEGVLTDASEPVETSEITLDYVPTHSARQGGLFFTRNPQDFQLQLRATGYTKP